MIEVDLTNLRALIWLASYPRSGNTWTRAILAALYHLTQNPSLEEIDINRLGGVSDNAAIFYRRFLDGAPNQVDQALIAKVRPLAQREIIAQAQGVQLVKTHSPRGRERGTPLIDEELTAGAVYLVRNPLDVAISMARFRNLSIDEVINFMAASNFGQVSGKMTVYAIFGTWSENVRSWAEPPDRRILLLRYEDMLEAPEAAASAIGNHVRLAPPPDLVAKAVRMASFGMLQEMENAHGFKDKPDASGQFFRSGQAGQWRTLLTSAQVNRIVGDHREQMERFGYLP